MTEREDYWYDRFWDNLSQDDPENDGTSAVRLLAEMHADGLYWRDGDNLVGREGSQTYLTADDQHLMRRIIQAAENAEIAP